VWKNDEELELSLIPRGEVFIRCTARMEAEFSSGIDRLLLVKIVRNFSTEEETKVDAAFNPDDEGCLAF